MPPSVSTSVDRVKHLLGRYPIVEEVVRFAVTGGMGLVANLCLMIALVELVSVPEQYASVVSTLVVLLGSFALTNWWVFDDVTTDDTTSGVVKRGVSYYAIMGAGKVVNYGIYLAFLSVGVWYPVAWLLGSVIVFLGTFTLNRLVWYRFE